ncbi:MAG: hypothetical protein K8T25_04560 [Planctomycetia bacterium]|nr:hypothetical protein [Planctomycetia bacterium]
MGTVSRSDKPVEEPTPGYLIIPDDKPADAFLIAFPGDDYVKAFIMAGTSLSDNGLRYLPKFPALHTFDASNTAITDKGLHNMRTAPALQNLSLRYTQITDKGLAHLKNIKTLTTLNLEGTAVSDQAILDLKQAIPGLTVTK